MDDTPEKQGKMSVVGYSIQVLDRKKERKSK
jgi:hypothetical protein